MDYSLDKPRANCAVVGVYGLEEASTLSYLSLYALQHRGQEATGIVSSNGENLHRHAGRGLVADVFKHRSTLANLSGKSSIGHNRYSTTGSSTEDNVQPLLFQDHSGQIALAHNGNLTNYHQLREFLEGEGSLFRTSCDSEIILQLLARTHRKDLKSRLFDVIRMVKGAYSLVMLSRNVLIAVRDPLGFRPLCLGKMGDGWIVASESCAFDLIGAEYVRDVKPGEMLVIDKNGCESHYFANGHSHAHCIFEFVYFSRPDSLIFGENVDRTRRKLGHVLAAKHNVPDADIVVSVPDSSNTSALGYAHEANIKFELALIRNHYVGRTFIEPEQQLRDFGVKLKFNVVKGVVDGKRVILVDDSIVRGTTLKKLVGLMRRAGAKEVHARISSPPITNPCYYGMDFPTREELAASSRSIEEIRKYIDADSLEYLTAAELLGAASKKVGQDFCTACFTGDYPIEVTESEGIVKIES